MTTTTAYAIEEWLAGSRNNPSEPLNDWTQRSYTVLPMGVRFDAVRIPSDLVHAAVDTADDGVDHTVVADALRLAVAGPVLADHTRWYYALVPPQSTDKWPCGLARCLGRGAWIVTPRATITDHIGVHWCVPMDHPGALCDPARVVALIERGRDRLNDARR
ncbi:hypothetical protein [Streptomyces sp. CAU 1734]|uniref:hypothetical protein n=1 Tax=Streptomyces sp. CAU 1734 TaxID=3140360 RepID=UPI003260109E